MPGAFSHGNTACNGGRLARVETTVPGQIRECFEAAIGHQYISFVSMSGAPPTFILKESVFSRATAFRGRLTITATAAIAGFKNGRLA
jgi:hypothetical protein